jgi:hypothetical protein
MATFTSPMLDQQTTHPERFNPHATHAERAVQAWQILIGMAKNRQTATYEGFSILMYGKKAPNVMDDISGTSHFIVKTMATRRLPYSSSGSGAEFQDTTSPKIVMKNVKRCIGVTGTTSTHPPRRV